MEAAGERIPYRTYCISGVILICAIIEVAYVKTAYNVPYHAIELTYNLSACSEPKICGSLKDHKPMAVIFWSTLAVSEQVGRIPAFLSGRFLAENYGKTAVMTVAMIPTTAGILLQAASGFYKNNIIFLLPLGRMLQAFGATWLLLVGTSFVLDLLYPTIAFNSLFHLINTVLAATMPLIQICGLDQVLGTRSTWPWLTGIACGPLVVMLMVLMVIPEPPRFLHSLGDRRALSQSREFYFSQQSPTTSERGNLEFTRNRNLFILNFIRQQQPRQLAVVKIVIVCKITQELIMSNIVYLFSTMALHTDTKVSHDTAGLETIGIFSFGFATSVISCKMKWFHKNPNFHLTCIAMAIWCIVSCAVVSFLDTDLLVQIQVPAVALLVGCYHLGLASMVADIASSRLLAVAQDPTLTLAAAVSGLTELCITGTFVPLMYMAGPGFSWLPVAVALIICFCYLLFELPKKQHFQMASENQSEKMTQEYEPSTPSHWSGQSSPGFRRQRSFSDSGRHSQMPPLKQQRKKSRSLGRLHVTRRIPMDLFLDQDATVVEASTLSSFKSLEKLPHKRQAKYSPTTKYTRK